MAQCCSDLTAIHLDNFDDGAPLSARYININNGAAVTASEGINSTAGAGGINGANFKRRFDDNLDRCENFRTGFAIGFWYKPTDADDVDDGVSIMEIRGPGSPFVGDRDVIESTLLGIAIYGTDLVVVEGTNIHLDEPAYTIYNAFPLNELTFVEVRGGINPYGTDPAQGWMEVQINGEYYAFGEDVATVDVEDENRFLFPPCQRLALDGGFALGWDCVFFEPYGFIDCLYIKETAAFCNFETKTNKPQPCDPPGPAGSTFDGTASGDRIVHKNGYVTPYVAPTYNGTPATASDPSDAQTLTNAASVVVTTKITLCDASVKRYAQVPVVRSGVALTQHRVNRYGPIPFRLADRFGNLPSQTYEIELADEDGELRALLASGVNRFWTRWQVDIEVSSDVARLAGTAPRSLARSRVIAPPVTSDRTVTLVCGDELTRQYGATSLDRELPWVRMRDVFKSGFTATGMIYQKNLPDDLEDQVLPILYGECSDDIRQQQNITPAGIDKVYYAGTFLLKSGSQRWYGFLVSLYAIKDPTGGGLYASNMDPECPGSVRIDPDKYSTDWLVPGKGQWSSYFSTNYHDVTVGGTTYRITMIFGRGRVAKQHVDGKVPISVNAFGIETTGNTAGTMISDGNYILQHLFDHPVLRRTTSGNWGAAATFSDGVAKVRTTSFLATKTIHADRISTGQRGRLILDEPRPAKDWIADACVSWDLRPYINHHGQIVATTLDDTAAITGLTTFTELLHIKEGSFQIQPERNGDVENMQPYQFGPEPATGRFAGSNTKKVAAAITNWGEERAADPLVYEGHYLSAAALDVTSRRLLATKDGIVRGVFDIDHAGIDLTPGQLIRLTHASGFGTLGWTDRILRVVGVIVHPDVDDLFCTVEWEDVQGLLAHTGSSTDGAVGFQPIGSSAGLTAKVLGSSVSGTAYRLG